MKRLICVLLVLTVLLSGCSFLEFGLEDLFSGKTETQEERDREQEHDGGDFGIHWPVQSGSEQTEPRQTQPPQTQPRATEPAQTQPPQTQPTVTPSRGTQVYMDSSTQYEINIFLSNFAEQRVCEGWEVAPGESFHVDSPDVENMGKFIFHYYRINIQKYLTEVPDDRANVSGPGAAYAKLDQVREDMRRFFGISPTEQQMIDAGLDVRNGRLYDGYEPVGQHSYLAVVPALYDNGDGTYTAEFEIYRTMGEIERGTYYKTAAQIRSAPDMDLDGKGKAVVRPYNHNGRNTYRLISYTIQE